ncbi:aspartate/glutamate racemase family protein [Alteribacillus bidgolensis]|uniref:Aspartate racemase n=1 Tax=Alteribacillus bidgolensis TaxID=930129 RepID=A0A1G8HLS5_9BACI|nr:aspartate/glutamate racemase family protein [Alteribacillus bidgolensis]SDI07545.1 aspartate racemase [Alteribacillus bidgolensis]
MKKIGLIGGISWQSTHYYYKKINEEVSQRLGGMHSARVLLESVDFNDIVAAQENDDWELVGETLTEAALNLEKGGAQFLAICSNTVHAAASKVQHSSNLPFIHIADATADAVKNQGIVKVGLIGTEYLMKSSWYRERLHSCSIEVILPGEVEQKELQRQIFEELCFSHVRSSSKRQTVNILNNMRKQGAEGMVLGCTEFGLMLQEKDVSYPIFDSSEIHIKKITDQALN